jgi:hypothetical protein
MNKSSLGWGAILLLLGGLMLADEMGLRLPGGTAPMAFFWPLVLILFGGWMVLSVFLRGGAPASESASVNLQGASEASVRVNHGAGELRIGSGTGMDELANGVFTGGLEQKSRFNGNTLEVRMSPPQQSFPFFFGNWERYDWDMRLNSRIPMALKLEMGANKTEADLHDLRLTSLKVETGASDTRIRLPAQGRFHADFSLGAASLTLTVPEGVAARIRVTTGVSGVSVNPSRFPRMGEYYQSPDYDTAPNAIDMKIEAGAAEIKVL